MKTNISTSPYKGFRFPPAIINHAVWLSFRFTLSVRDVEEIMAERGVVLTYETIRQWCLKFRQTYANELKHRRSRSGDKWHLNEVFLTINGKLHSL
jgi:putative transposase